LAGGGLILQTNLARSQVAELRDQRVREGIEGDAHIRFGR